MDSTISIEDSGIGMQNKYSATGASSLIPPLRALGAARPLEWRGPLPNLYIKTNSGTTTSMLPGSGGEITNITYENIEIYNPSWWGIYIGPQQQHEPNG